MSLASKVSSTVQRELPSFKTPPKRDVAAAPAVGSKAPESSKLQLPHDKPTIVVFLRHCGCPFAEKAFRRLAAISSQHPEVHCVAVSHSSQEATDRWIPQVGGEWETEVVVDEERELYAAWGLGTSSTWHVYNPWAVYNTVALGRSEGIWSRPTESGSRWQMGGAFALDREGVVRWARVAKAADDVPNLEEALRSLGLEPKKGDGK